MKLVHRDLERQILFDTSNGCEWIIESPELFAKYLQELYIQSEGGEGNFVLSNNDKELEIAKYAELILHPFSVNINDKKILNKLYAELGKLALGEDMYLLTQEMQGKLQEYFFQLEQLCPYSLTTEQEIDVTDLFKAIGVKCEKLSDNFFENLTQYIKILAELLRKEVIIFVNIRSYISDAQLKHLLKEAAYNEIHLLLIENQKRSFSDGLTEYIIDIDKCEI